MSAGEPCSGPSSTVARPKGKAMKFRWSDWLAAVAVVMALSAFAAAEGVDEGPTPALAR